MEVPLNVPSLFRVGCDQRQRFFRDRKFRFFKNTVFRQQCIVPVFTQTVNLIQIKRRLPDQTANRGIDEIRMSSPQRLPQQFDTRFPVFCQRSQAPD